MKKLKAALILLFAVLMSLCLFACGGGNEGGGNEGGGGNPGGDQPGGDQPGGDDGEEIYVNVRINPSSITLNDSADEAALKAKYATVKLTCTPLDTSLDRVDVPVSECTVTGEVKLHEVGEYTVTVKPAGSEKTARLTVVIEHTWADQGSGVQECTYDHARQETRTEDVVIHYGTFHQGTDATLPAGVWSENSVYTNKNASGSAISEFGSVNGRKVPTLTAGHLEPGMTITISGQAMTTSKGAEKAGPYGVWGQPGYNANWNSPSLGIADRYNTTTQNAEGANYQYGVSVIVRQEGWVLYNGIGDTLSNSTLAALTNGPDDETDTWVNYGSHVDATDNLYPTKENEKSGYVHGVIPTDWSTVKDWWVYSDGTTLPSGSYYSLVEDENGNPDISQAGSYEYTWNYREDNVIEITYSYTVAGGTTAVTMKAYIKVPDPSVGYYDTIIHGDYNDMTITKSVITTKRTPNTVNYKGVKTGAAKVYAENTSYDAANALDFEIDYTQNTGKFETLRVTGAQIYAYKGSLTRAQLLETANKTTLESLSENDWVSLGTNSLSSDYSIFKYHIIKGGKTFVGLLGENDLKVVSNSVDPALPAVGADVTAGGETFFNNDKVGEFTFVFDPAAQNQVTLKLSGGYVQTLTDAQKGKLFATTANKYLALRINKGALGEAFKATGLTVSVPYYAAVEGDDLLLVLGLTQAGKVTLTGAQDTKIVLDLSEVKGFDLESKVEKKDTVSLNKGGDVTITYKLPSGTAAADLTLTVAQFPVTVSDYINEQLAPGGIIPAKAQALGGTGYLLKEVHFSETELKVVIGIPAASYASYAPAVVTLATKTDSIADTIDYDLAIAEDAGYVQGEGYSYAYVATDKVLNVIAVRSSNDLQDGTLAGSFTLNINDGNSESFAQYRLLNVNYRVVGGELVLTGTPEYVTGYVQLLGTFGDARDTDKGAYIVFAIDVTAIGITGDYYFDFAEGTFDATDAGKPTSLNKVSAGKLSSVSLASGYEMELYSAGDGNCYDEGLYAWAVKQNGNVIFYANAAVAGGEHVDGNSDGKCDLCGGTIESAALPVWGATKAYNNFKSGDVVESKGTWASTVKDQDSNFGPVMSILDGSDRYWLRTDGFFVMFPNGAWWTPDTDQTPYNEETSTGNNENMGSTLPYNTLNGVVTLDGTTLNTDSMSSLTSYFEDKSYHIVVLYQEDTVEISVSIYNESDVLVLNYKVYIYNMTHTLTVEFTSQPADTQSGNVEFTRWSLYNSVIDNAVSQTVGGHTAPTGIEYSDSVSGTNAVVALTGTATHENSGYYVAFRVNFKQALVASTAAPTITKKDGSAITGATVTLAENKQYVDVYLPIADGLKEALIKFVNYEASTLQADILIDLTDLAVSDVVSTVAGYDALTIAEGSFTVTYTNAQNSDNLVIGTVSKALSALTTKTDFGNGYSAQVSFSGTTATVTVTKAAANLTKAIEGVELRLERSGDLLARDVLDPVVARGARGTEIGDSAWYAEAKGAQLVLFSASNNGIELNVNAGDNTADELVRYYSIALTADGKAFTDAGTALAKASKLVYSASGSAKLYVIVIDLTSFGVESTTAYGFQQKDQSTYYTVSTARAIAPTTAVTDGKTQSTILEGSCVQDGAKGYLTDAKDFYYNVEFTPATGHHFEVKADADKKDYDTVYECSGCHALKYEQTTATQSWGNKGVWENGNPGYIYVGVLPKGGYYEITGTTLSNMANVWDLMTPGINSKAPAEGETMCGAIGLRIDHWVMNHSEESDMSNFKGDSQPTATAGLVYSVYDNKANAAADFGTLENTIKAALDGATVTYVFDYLNVSRLIVACTIKNGDLDLTVTYTYTGTLLDTYYVFLHPDGCKYTASAMTNIVPAGTEPSKALSKHVHDWSQSDKCSCGEIYSGHGTEEGHPHKKGEDNVHCEICGAVMEHDHKYNSYYVCEYCGMVDYTTLASLATTEESNAAGSFGQTADWWQSPSAYLTKSGDFLLKFTFSCGTCNGNTAAFEMLLSDTTDWNDGYFDYNPNDGNIWGGIVNATQNIGLDATKAPATYKTTEDGAKPAYGTDVTYVVYAYRIGANFVMSYQMLKAEQIVYTLTLVSENFATGDIQVHISGYNTGMTDFKAYTGTISAKA